MPPERHETQPFRTKWTLDVQNLGKIAILKRRIGNPFARNGRWTPKTEEKLQLLLVARNPFARNGRWTSKTEEKLRLLLRRAATLSHEMDVGR